MRALLLLCRTPCCNKHGTARTTQHVTTRTTRRACVVMCRDVTQQVEFWLTHLSLTSNLTTVCISLSVVVTFRMT